MTALGANERNRDRCRASPPLRGYQLSHILQPILWAAAIFFVLLPVHLVLSQSAYDDAYIHIRIAQHLAEGLGPFFNPPEGVNADSASGWVLLLSLFFKCLGTNPSIVAVLNAAFTSLGTVLWGSLLSDRSARASSRFLPGLGGHLAS